DEGEFPVGIARRAFELDVRRREVAGLERLRLGAALHAGDAAARRVEQNPVGLAGHGVGVDAPKMAPRYRKAVVLDQVLERAREARLARRRAGVVVHEGLAVLVADEEQLLLALALRRRAPDFAGRGERDAEERHRDQDAEIGESPFRAN